MPQIKTMQVDAKIEAAAADLACAFRWTARLNMHESVANHFSVAVSEQGNQFLINKAGVHFSRVKASELLLVDTEKSDKDEAIDPTAWALHGAIHKNVPSARCLLHVHSKYATVLASLADSTLEPIDQNTMRFYNRYNIDDGFDGMGLGDEAERVSKLLQPEKPILIMGNHGVMVVADSVAKAFDELYYFERACETYITALMTGKPLRVVSDVIASKTARQWCEYAGFAQAHFSELKNILNEEGSNYAE
jgi:ribulose-5-phosphate 4-epimerase/fuculose-1-phosphate aldolase